MKTPSPMAFIRNGALAYSKEPSPISMPLFPKPSPRRKTDLEYCKELMSLSMPPFPKSSPRLKTDLDYSYSNEPLPNSMPLFPKHSPRHTKNLSYNEEPSSNLRSRFRKSNRCCKAGRCSSTEPSFIHKSPLHRPRTRHKMMPDYQNEKLLFREAQCCELGRFSPIQNQVTSSGKAAFTLCKKLDKISPPHSGNLNDFYAERRRNEYDKSRWEAMEVRYIDANNRVLSSSSTDNGKSKVLDLSGKGKWDELHRQTVKVEKLVVSNLLNTSRRVCGQLGTSRKSEYKPFSSSTLALQEYRSKDVSSNVSADIKTNYLKTLVKEPTVEKVSVDSQSYGADRQDNYLSEDLKSEYQNLIIQILKERKTAKKRVTKKCIKEISGESGVNKQENCRNEVLIDEYRDLILQILLERGKARESVREINSQESFIPNKANQTLSSPISNSKKSGKLSNSLPLSQDALDDLNRKSPQRHRVGVSTKVTEQIAKHRNRMEKAKSSSVKSFKMRSGFNKLWKLDSDVRVKSAPRICKTQGCDSFEGDDIPLNMNAKNMTKQENIMGIKLSPLAQTENKRKKINRENHLSEIPKQMQNSQNDESKEKCLLKSLHKQNNSLTNDDQLLQSILKSPTAKAVQALCLFYQKVNRGNNAKEEEMSECDVSVEDILKAYQKLFLGSSDTKCLSIPNVQEMHQNISKQSQKSEILHSTQCPPKTNQGSSHEIQKNPKHSPTCLNSAQYHLNINLNTTPPANKDDASKQYDIPPSPSPNSSSTYSISLMRSMSPPIQTYKCAYPVASFTEEKKSVKITKKANMCQTSSDSFDPTTSERRRSFNILSPRRYSSYSQIHMKRLRKCYKPHSDICNASPHSFDPKIAAKKSRIIGNSSRLSNELGNPSPNTPQDTSKSINVKTQHFRQTTRGLQFIDTTTSPSVLYNKKKTRFGVSEKVPDEQQSKNKKNIKQTNLIWGNLGNVQAKFQTNKNYKLSHRPNAPVNLKRTFSDKGISRGKSDYQSIAEERRKSLSLTACRRKINRLMKMKRKANEDASKMEKEQKIKIPVNCSESEDSNTAQSQKDSFNNTRVSSTQQLTTIGIEKEISTEKKQENDILFQQLHKYDQTIDQMKDSRDSIKSRSEMSRINNDNVMNDIEAQCIQRIEFSLSENAGVSGRLLNIDDHNHLESRNDHKHITETQSPVIRDQGIDTSKFQKLDPNLKLQANKNGMEMQIAETFHASTTSSSTQIQDVDIMDNLITKSETQQKLSYNMPMQDCLEDTSTARRNELINKGDSTSEASEDRDHSETTSSVNLRDRTVKNVVNYFSCSSFAPTRDTMKYNSKDNNESPTKDVTLLERLYRGTIGSVFKPENMLKTSAKSDPIKTKNESMSILSDKEHTSEWNEPTTSCFDSTMSVIEKENTIHANSDFSKTKKITGVEILTDNTSKEEATNAETGTKLTSLNFVGTCKSNKQDIVSNELPITVFSNDNEGNLTIVFPTCHNSKANELNENSVSEITETVINNDQCEVNESVKIEEPGSIENWMYNLKTQVSVVQCNNKGSTSETSSVWDSLDDNTKYEIDQHDDSKYGCANRYSQSTKRNPKGLQKSPLKAINEDNVPVEIPVTLLSGKQENDMKRRIVSKVNPFEPWPVQKIVYDEPMYSCTNEDEVFTNQCSYIVENQIYPLGIHEHNKRRSSATELEIGDLLMESQRDDQCFDIRPPIPFRYGKSPIREEESFENENLGKPQVYHIPYLNEQIYHDEINKKVDEMNHVQIEPNRKFYDKMPSRNFGESVIIFKYTGKAKDKEEEFLTESDSNCRTTQHNVFAGDIIHRTKTQSHVSEEDIDHFKPVPTEEIVDPQTIRKQYSDAYDVENRVNVRNCYGDDFSEKVPSNIYCILKPSYISSSFKICGLNQDEVYDSVTSCDEDDIKSSSAEVIPPPLAFRTRNYSFQHFNHCTKEDFPDCAVRSNQGIRTLGENNFETFTSDILLQRSEGARDERIPRGGNAASFYEKKATTVNEEDKTSENGVPFHNIEKTVVNSVKLLRKDAPVSINSVPCNKKVETIENATPIPKKTETCVNGVSLPDNDETCVNSVSLPENDETIVNGTPFYEHEEYVGIIFQFNEKNKQLVNDVAYEENIENGGPFRKEEGPADKCVTCCKEYGTAVNEDASQEYDNKVIQSVSTIESNEHFFNSIPFYKKCETDANDIAFQKSVQNGNNDVLFRKEDKLIVNDFLINKNDETVADTVTFFVNAERIGNLAPFHNNDKTTVKGIQEKHAIDVNGFPFLGNYETNEKCVTFKKTRETLVNVSDSYHNEEIIVNGVLIHDKNEMQRSNGNDKTVVNSVPIHDKIEMQRNNGNDKTVVNSVPIHDKNEMEHSNGKDEAIINDVPVSAKNEMERCNGKDETIVNGVPLGKGAVFGNYESVGAEIVEKAENSTSGKGRIAEDNGVDNEILHALKTDETFETSVGSQIKNCATTNVRKVYADECVVADDILDTEKFCAAANERKVTVDKCVATDELLETVKNCTATYENKVTVDKCVATNEFDNMINKDEVIHEYDDIVEQIDTNIKHITKCETFDESVKTYEKCVSTYGTGKTVEKFEAIDERVQIIDKCLPTSDSKRTVKQREATDKILDTSEKNVTYDKSVQNIEKCKVSIGRVDIDEKCSTINESVNTVIKCKITEECLKTAESEKTVEKCLAIDECVHTAERCLATGENDNTVEKCLAADKSVQTVEKWEATNGRVDIHKKCVVAAGIGKTVETILAKVKTRETVEKCNAADKSVQTVEIRLATIEKHGANKESIEMVDTVKKCVVTDKSGNTDKKHVTVNKKVENILSDRQGIDVFERNKTSKDIGVNMDESIEGLVGTTQEHIDNCEHSIIEHAKGVTLKSNAFIGESRRSAEKAVQVDDTFKPVENCTVINGNNGTVKKDDLTRADGKNDKNRKGAWVYESEDIGLQTDDVNDLLMKRVTFREMGKTSEINKVADRDNGVDRNDLRIVDTSEIAKDITCEKAETACQGDLSRYCGYRSRSESDERNSVSDIGYMNRYARTSFPEMSGKVAEKFYDYKQNGKNNLCQQTLVSDESESKAIGRNRHNLFAEVNKPRVLGKCATGQSKTIARFNRCIDDNSTLTSSHHGIHKKCDSVEKDTTLHDHSSLVLSSRQFESDITNESASTQNSAQKLEHDMELKTDNELSCIPLLVGGNEKKVHGFRTNSNDKGDSVKSTVEEKKKSSFEWGSNENFDELSFAQIPKFLSSFTKFHHQDFQIPLEKAALPCTCNRVQRFLNSAEDDTLSKCIDLFSARLITSMGKTLSQYIQKKDHDVSLTPTRDTTSQQQHFNTSSKNGNSAHSQVKNSTDQFKNKELVLPSCDFENSNILNEKRLTPHEVRYKTLKDDSPCKDKPCSNFLVNTNKNIHFTTHMHTFQKARTDSTIEKNLPLDTITNQNKIRCSEAYTDKDQPSLVETLNSAPDKGKQKQHLFSEQVLSTIVFDVQAYLYHLRNIIKLQKSERFSGFSNEPLFFRHESPPHKRTTGGRRESTLKSERSPFKNLSNDLQQFDNSNFFDGLTQTQEAQLFSYRSTSDISLYQRRKTKNTLRSENVNGKKHCKMSIGQSTYNRFSPAVGHISNKNIDYIERGHCNLCKKYKIKSFFTQPHNVPGNIIRVTSWSSNAESEILPQIKEKSPATYDHMYKNGICCGDRNIREYSDYEFDTYDELGSFTTEMQSSFTNYYYDSPGSEVHPYKLKDYSRHRSSLDLPTSCKWLQTDKIQQISMSSMVIQPCYRHASVSPNWRCRVEDRDKSPISIKPIKHTTPSCNKSISRSAYTQHNKTTEQNKDINEFLKNCLLHYRHLENSNIRQTIEYIISISLLKFITDLLQSTTTKTCTNSSEELSKTPSLLKQNVFQKFGPTHQPDDEFRSLVTHKNESYPRGYRMGQRTSTSLSHEDLTFLQRKDKSKMHSLLSSQSNSVGHLGIRMTAEPMAQKIRKWSVKTLPEFLTMERNERADRVPSEYKDTNTRQVCRGREQSNSLYEDDSDNLSWIHRLSYYDTSSPIFPIFHTQKIKVSSSGRLKKTHANQNKKTEMGMSHSLSPTSTSVNLQNTHTIPRDDIMSSRLGTDNDYINILMFNNESGLNSISHQYLYTSKHAQQHLNNIAKNENGFKRYAREAEPTAFRTCVETHCDHSTNELWKPQTNLTLKLNRNSTERYPSYGTSTKKQIPSLEKKVQNTIVKLKHCGTNTRVDVKLDKATSISSSKTKEDLFDLYINQLNEIRSDMHDKFETMFQRNNDLNNSLHNKNSPPNYDTGVGIKTSQPINDEGMIGFSSFLAGLDKQRGVGRGQRVQTHNKDHTWNADISRQNYETMLHKEACSDHRNISTLSSFLDNIRVHKGWDKCWNDGSRNPYFRKENYNYIDKKSDPKLQDGCTYLSGTLRPSVSDDSLVFISKFEEDDDDEEEEEEEEEKQQLQNINYVTGKVFSVPIKWKDRNINRKDDNDLFTVYKNDPIKNMEMEVGATNRYQESIATKKSGYYMEGGNIERIWPEIVKKDDQFLEPLVPIAEDIVNFSENALKNSEHGNATKDYGASPSLSNTKSTNLRQQPSKENIIIDNANCSNIISPLVEEGVNMSNKVLLSVQADYSRKNWKTLGGKSFSNRNHIKTKNVRLGEICYSNKQKPNCDHKYKIGTVAGGEHITSGYFFLDFEKNCPRQEKQTVPDEMYADINGSSNSSDILDRNTRQDKLASDNIFAAMNSLCGFVGTVSNKDVEDRSVPYRCISKSWTHLKVKASSAESRELTVSKTGILSNIGKVEEKVQMYGANSVKSKHPAVSLTQNPPIKARIGPFVLKKHEQLKNKGSNAYNTLSKRNEKTNGKNNDLQDKTAQLFGSNKEYSSNVTDIPKNTLCDKMYYFCEKNEKESDIAKQLHSETDIAEEYVCKIRASTPDMFPDREVNQLYGKPVSQSETFTRNSVPHEFCEQNLLHKYEKDCFKQIDRRALSKWENPTALPSHLHKEMYNGNKDKSLAEIETERPSDDHCIDTLERKPSSPNVCQETVPNDSIREISLEGEEHHLPGQMVLNTFFQDNGPENPFQKSITNQLNDEDLLNPASYSLIENTSHGADQLESRSEKDLNSVDKENITAGQFHVCSTSYHFCANKDNKITDTVLSHSNLYRNLRFRMTTSENDIYSLQCDNSMLPLDVLLTEKYSSLCLHENNIPTSLNDISNENNCWLLSSENNGADTKSNKNDSSPLQDEKNKFPLNTVESDENDDSSSYDENNQLPLNTVESNENDDSSSHDKNNQIPLTTEVSNENYGSSSHDDKNQFLQNIVKSNEDDDSSSRDDNNQLLQNIVVKNENDGSSPHDENNQLSLNIEPKENISSLLSKGKNLLPLNSTAIENHCYLPYNCVNTVLPLKTSFNKKYNSSMNNAPPPFNTASSDKDSSSLSSMNDAPPPLEIASSEKDSSLLSSMNNASSPLKTASSEKDSPLLSCTNNAPPPLKIASSEKGSPLLSSMNNAPPPLKIASIEKDSPLLSCMNDAPPPLKTASSEKHSSLLSCMNDAPPPLEIASSEIDSSLLSCMNNAPPPLEIASNHKCSSLLFCETNGDHNILQLKSTPSEKVSYFPPRITDVLSLNKISNENVGPAFHQGNNINVLPLKKEIYSSLLLFQNATLTQNGDSNEKDNGAILHCGNNILPPINTISDEKATSLLHCENNILLSTTSNEKYSSLFSCANSVIRINNVHEKLSKDETEADPKLPIARHRPDHENAYQERKSKPLKHFLSEKQNECKDNTAMAGKSYHHYVNSLSRLTNVGKKCTTPDEHYHRTKIHQHDKCILPITQKTRVPSSPSSQQTYFQPERVQFPPFNTTEMYSESPDGNSSSTSFSSPRVIHDRKEAKLNIDVSSSNLRRDFKSSNIPTKPLRIKRKKIPKSYFPVEIKSGSSKQIIEDFKKSKAKPSQIPVDVYKLQPRGKKSRTLTISGPLMNMNIPVFRHGDGEVRSIGQKKNVKTEEHNLTTNPKICDVTNDTPGNALEGMSSTGNESKNKLSIFLRNLVPFGKKK